jgi:electron transfer flavoprotein beta subunit
MQEGGIEQRPAAEPELETGVTVRRMFAPESSSHAEMLSGDADAVAARIIEIIRERGALRS